MIRGAWFLLVLASALGLSLDCKKDRPAEVESAAASKPPVERPGATPMPDEETRIADAQLSRCMESAGVVVLVQVDHAEVRAPGTRGESAWFQGTVKRAIYGKPEDRVEFWCYTRQGDTKLLEGSKYVVAISGSGGGFVPQTMIGHVVVAPGDEDRIVKAHEDAVNRLSAPP